MESFLKEIQKDQAKGAKVPLVELIKGKIEEFTKRLNIVEKLRILKISHFISLQCCSIRSYKRPGDTEECV